jgi:hypothetical protein
MNDLDLDVARARRRHVAVRRHAGGIQSEKRMADVTAALVCVATHLVERVAVAEQRTTQAITADMRTSLIPLTE